MVFTFILDSFSDFRIGDDTVHFLYEREDDNQSMCEMLSLSSENLGVYFEEEWAENNVYPKELVFDKKALVVFQDFVRHPNMYENKCTFEGMRFTYMNVFTLQLDVKVPIFFRGEKEDEQDIRCFATFSMLCVVGTARMCPQVRLLASKCVDEARTEKNRAGCDQAVARGVITSLKRMAVASIMTQVREEFKDHNNTMCCNDGLPLPKAIMRTIQLERCQGYDPPFVLCRLFPTVFRYYSPITHLFTCCEQKGDSSHVTVLTTKDKIVMERNHFVALKSAVLEDESGEWAMRCVVIPCFFGQLGTNFWRQGICQLASETFFDIKHHIYLWLRTEDGGNDVFIMIDGLKSKEAIKKPPTTHSVCAINGK